MNVPFYILLIIYMLGIVVFMVWTFFNLYHMVRFGLFDFSGKMNTFVFVALVGIILFITALLLQGTPWFDTFPVLQNLSFDSLPNPGNAR